MKAYLIDPFAKTVSEVQYNGDYKTIYNLISSDNIKVDTFTCVEINDQSDTIYVDDEGLNKNLNQQAFFMFNGTPLAGKGLVLGTDEEGDSQSPTITLQELMTENKIEFLSLAQVRKQVAQQ